MYNVNNITSVPYNEKVKVIVLVGLPGSGKSTYRDLIKENNYAYISSDELRKLFWGDENCQKNPKKVFDTFYRVLNWEMRCRYNTIIDATNVTMKTRKQIFDTIAPYRDNVTVKAVVFNIPYEEILERNSVRDRCLD